MREPLSPIMLGNIQTAQRGNSGNAVAHHLLGHVRAMRAEATASPMTAVLEGDLDRALRLADARSSSACLTWLLLLAAHFSQAGDSRSNAIVLGRIAFTALPIDIDSDHLRLVVGCLKHLLPQGDSPALSLVLETLPHSHAVELLTDVERFDDAERVARSIEDPATRADAFSYLSASLATRERTVDSERTSARAEEAVESLSDVASRACVTVDLAKTQARIGNATTATRFCERAAGMLDAISEDLAKTFVVSKLAIAYAMMSDLQRAELMLNLLGRDESAVVTGSAIAKTLIDQGDFPSAARFVARSEDVTVSIDNIRNRDVAASHIAATLVRLGDLPAAHALVGGFDDVSHRAFGMRFIANALVDAGHFDSADEIIQAIPDVWNKTNALAHAAEGHIVFGDLPAASRLFNQSELLDLAIEHAQTSALVLSQISNELEMIEDPVRARLLAHAEKSADRLSSAPRRAETQAIVAAAHAKAGDIDGAHRIVDGIASRWGRAFGMARVASAIAGEKTARLLAEAEQIASPIRLLEQKVFVFCELAGVHAERANTIEAKRLLSAAEEKAAAIEEKDWRDFSLAEVAAAMARCGDTSGAERLAAIVTDSTRYAPAFIRLAGGLAAIGNPGEAHRISDSLDDPEDRAGARAAIAASIARHDDPATAVRMAKELEVDRATHAGMIGAALLSRTQDAAALAEFDEIVPLAADDLPSAIHMAALLTRRYPEQAAAIAEIVVEAALAL